MKSSTKLNSGNLSFHSVYIKPLNPEQGGTKHFKHYLLVVNEFSLRLVSTM